MPDASRTSSPRREKTMTHRLSPGAEQFQGSLSRPRITAFSSSGAPASIRTEGKVMGTAESPERRSRPIAWSVRRRHSARKNQPSSPGKPREQPSRYGDRNSRHFRVVSSTRKERLSSETHKVGNPGTRSLRNSKHHATRCTFLDVPQQRRGHRDHAWRLL